MRPVVDASVVVEWLVVEEDTDVADRLLADGDSRWVQGEYTQSC